METSKKTNLKILILCTGNSCRSQMAEGFLKALNPSLEVYSAGTRPEKEINPRTVIVMNELGIDLSGNKPDPVENYLNTAFDYVITVCDGAKKSCPAFTGVVRQSLHIGFDDPAEYTGPDEEVLPVYRRIRDEIKLRMGQWYSGINNH